MSLEKDNRDLVKGYNPKDMLYNERHGKKLRVFLKETGVEVTSSLDY
jgi:hypothetical protein